MDTVGAPNWTIPTKALARLARSAGNMSEQSAFETLGLPSNASPNDVKKAYRALGAQSSPLLSAFFF